MVAFFMGKFLKHYLYNQQKIIFGYLKKFIVLQIIDNQQIRKS